MSLYWKLVILLVIKDFTGFVSTFNTEFETVFLNVLFSLIEYLTDVQFAITLLFSYNCDNFSVVYHQSYSMFHVTWTIFKFNRDQLGTVSTYVM